MPGYIDTGWRGVDDLPEGLGKHQVQVQHGPGRQMTLGYEQRAIQALNMKR